MKTTALASLFLLALSFGAAAQETIVWSDIDCSQTRLVTPTGLRCRETNVVGTRGLATSTGGGQVKRWNAFGTLQQVKLFYYAQQVLSPRTYIQVGKLAENIRGLSPDAKNASNMASEPTQRAGADLLTFVGTKGESCVAIRKLGGSTSGGYAWVLYATRCAPGGRKASDAEIDDFVSAANFRPE